MVAKALRKCLGFEPEGEMSEMSGCVKLDEVEGKKGALKVEAKVTKTVSLFLVGVSVWSKRLWLQRAW